MTISLPAPAELPGTDDEDVTRLLLCWLMAQQSVHTRRAYARDTDPALAPLAEIPPREPRAGPAVLTPRIPRIPPWRQWCRIARVSPVTGITRNHVNLYARAMEAANLSPSTRARKLSAISSWYGWLIEEDRIQTNPAAHVNRPKVDRDTSMTPGLTREQAVAIQAVADAGQGSQRLRASAMMAVMLLTAARTSEIVLADIEDLGTNRGHRVLWVTRKGGKRQALALPVAVTNRLDAYLASRGDVTSLPAVPGQPGAPRPRRPLFATETGTRLWEADIWHQVRALGKAAGLPADLYSKIGPHAMRHTAITLALDSGAPLRDVQDLAGHADPRTTRRYDRSRYSLDRSPSYALASYLASSEDA